MSISRIALHTSHIRGHNDPRLTELFKEVTITSSTFQKQEGKSFKSVSFFFSFFYTGKANHLSFSLIVHLFILPLPDMQQILVGKDMNWSPTPIVPFRRKTVDVPGSPVVETWASNAGVASSSVLGLGAKIHVPGYKDIYIYIYITETGL